MILRRRSILKGALLVLLPSGLITSSLLDKKEKDQRKVNQLLFDLSKTFSLNVGQSLSTLPEYKSSFSSKNHIVNHLYDLIFDYIEGYNSNNVELAVKKLIRRNYKQRKIINHDNWYLSEFEARLFFLSYQYSMAE